MRKIVDVVKRRCNRKLCLGIKTHAKALDKTRMNRTKLNEFGFKRRFGKSGLASTRVRINYRFEREGESGLVNQDDGYGEQLLNQLNFI